MGTRHLTIVHINQEYKIAQYGQWDGYPPGQGKTILKFLKTKFKKKTFLKNLESIKPVDDEVQKIIDEVTGPTNDGWMNINQAERYKNEFPELSRETGAEILNLIQNGEVRYHNSDIDFVKDSLFCEWAYVIDLDKNIFEVYTGFNKSPMKKTERFYSDKSNDGGYYPVTLVKKYSLKKLPSLEKFLSDTEKSD